MIRDAEKHQKTPSGIAATCLAAFTHAGISSLCRCVYDVTECIHEKGRERFVEIFFYWGMWPTNEFGLQISYVCNFIGVNVWCYLKLYTMQDDKMFQWSKSSRALRQSSSPEWLYFLCRCVILSFNIVDFRNIWQTKTKKTPFGWRTPLWHKVKATIRNLLKHVTRNQSTQLCCDLQLPAALCTALRGLDLIKNKKLQNTVIKQKSLKYSDWLEKRLESGCSVNLTSWEVSTAPLHNKIDFGTYFY